MEKEPEADDRAGKTRNRRRIGWVAVFLVVLLAPAPWLLFPDARLTDAGPATEPPIRPETPPEPPKPEPTARTEGARATEEAEPARNTCDDPRVLVDRTHALPEDYAPEDLVSLRDLGLPILGQEALLRREAAENLERLVVAAAAGGEELTVASAYRSYADQSTSYARLVSIYGEDADKTSAPPGHSQHQLGTAVDFTNAYVGYQVSRDFGRTSAARWLLDHAGNHGFVLAYPHGQAEKTGYRWEPWHYRHIGVANVREMNGADLGLQDFLLREGVLPRC